MTLPIFAGRPRCGWPSDAAPPSPPNCPWNAREWKSPTLPSRTRACQKALEGVPREIGAFAIIAIIEQTPARGPGEQHRQRRRARIVDDLRKTVDRLLEARVVAMDEHERGRLGVFTMRASKRAMAGVAVQRFGPHRREFMQGIRRVSRRPLHLADLPRAVRGDRDGNLGEGGPVAAFAGEHFAGLRALLATGGGYEDRHFAGPAAALRRSASAPHADARRRR